MVTPRRILRAIKAGWILAAEPTPTTSPAPGDRVMLKVQSVAAPHAPVVPLEEIDDARALVEAIAERGHGRIVASRHLERFVTLLACDDRAMLFSEKDALINNMASLAGCSADLLRRDIEIASEQRTRLDDEQTLERITGMSGPEPGAESADEDVQ